jgi:hypothetical protein
LKLSLFYRYYHYKQKKYQFGPVYSNFRPYLLLFPRAVPNFPNYKRTDPMVSIDLCILAKLPHEEIIGAHGIDAASVSAFHFLLPSSKGQSLETALLSTVSGIQSSTFLRISIVAAASLRIALEDVVAYPLICDGIVAVTQFLVAAVLTSRRTFSALATVVLALTSN